MIGSLDNCTNEQLYWIDYIRFEGTWVYVLYKKGQPTLSVCFWVAFFLHCGLLGWQRQSRWQQAPGTIHEARKPLQDSVEAVTEKRMVAVLFCFFIREKQVSSIIMIAYSKCVILSSVFTDKQ